MRSMRGSTAARLCPMDLLEIETESPMTREEAAALLHRIADSLSKHNELEFIQSGTRFHVEVPDAVRVEIELEVGDDESSIEFEVKW